MRLVTPTPDDVPGYLQVLWKELTLRPESWTPVLKFATLGDLTVVYSTQVGRKKQIGNYVLAWFNIVTSTFTHTTAAGDLQITGVGETALNVTGMQNLGSLKFQGITKANYTQFVPQLGAAGVEFVINASGSAQTNGNVGTADMPTGGSVILRGWILFPL